MMPDKKLTAQFNKFVGREVGVTETVHKTRHGDIKSVQPDQNDAALSELRAAAKAAGFRLRVWLPGTMGTMDYRMDRLNARVEKEQDGKYRIQDRFTIG